MKTRSIVLLLSIGLTGCQEPAGSNEASAVIANATSPMPTAREPSAAPAPDAPTGFTAAEQQNILSGVTELLASIPIRGIGGDFRGPCTSVFSLGRPVLRNVFINGVTGKARVSVPITAVNSPYGDIPNRCYGAPVGGWSIGTTATSTYEVNIEKWNAGWRLSTEQNLQPLG